MNRLVTEDLFAQFSFNTSLQTIINFLEENTAAIDYHFGRKNGLIQTMLLGVLDSFFKT